MPETKTAAPDAPLTIAGDVPDPLAACDITTTPTPQPNHQIQMTTTWTKRTQGLETNCSAMAETKHHVNINERPEP